MVQAIRNNETSAEVVKKFLSAAAALSERSDSNPVFMMWTIPTTILALMGVVYFAGKLYFYGTHVFRLYLKKNEAERLESGITFYILELPHKHMAGPVHQNRNGNITAVQVSQDQLQTF